MKYIPLTPNDVDFTVKVEQCQMPVRGNAMCSGDATVDKQAEDSIIARLHSGDELAWCDVTVYARWDGHTGFAHLGACNLDETYTVEQVVQDYDLRSEALDDLNKNVTLLGLTVVERFER